MQQEEYMDLIIGNASSEKAGPGQPVKPVTYLTDDKKSSRTLCISGNIVYSCAKKVYVY